MHVILAGKCNIIQQHHTILILVYVCAFYNNDDESHTKHKNILTHPPHTEWRQFQQGKILKST